MKDKNKKELENIVRRDDSGNEIEPSTKGLGKAYHNLARLFFEKSGLESKGYKPNPTYNYELLKEHREQLMNDFIIEYLAELEANDVNITEDDRRRLEVEWIKIELTVVDEWMEIKKEERITRARITEKVELGKYKKYLEDRLVAIQNPAKPDGEKQKSNQSPSYLPALPKILKTAFKQLKLLDTTGQFIGDKRQIKPLFDVLVAKGWFKAKPSKTKKSDDFAALMQSEFGFSITGKTIRTGERDKDQEESFNEFNRNINSNQGR